MSVQNQTSSTSYSAIALGFAATGVSIASVKYQEKIIEALSPVVGAAISALAQTAATLTQNTGAVVGGAVGTWIILESLTAPNNSRLKSACNSVKNAGLSVLGSAGMVALAKTDIPSQVFEATRTFVMGAGKNYLTGTVIPAIQTPLGANIIIASGAVTLVSALAGITSKNNADEAQAAQERRNEQLKETNELIAKAEQGDQSASTEIVNKFLVQKPTYLDTCTRKKAGKLIKTKLKELAKDKDKLPTAMNLLGMCFYRGIGFEQNTNTAYVCFSKAAQLNEPNALQTMINYNSNPWNAPIINDYLTEQLINVSLNIESAKTAIPAT